MPRAGLQPLPSGPWPYTRLQCLVMFYFIVLMSFCSCAVSFVFFLWWRQKCLEDENILETMSCRFLKTASIIICPSKIKVFIRKLPFYYRIVGRSTTASQNTSPYNFSGLKNFYSQQKQKKNISFIIRRSVTASHDHVLTHFCCYDTSEFIIVIANWTCLQQI